jgi:hippurate hydrolase
MKVIESILSDAVSIQSVRRDIHAHPELCFEEHRTADIIAQQLQSFGIPFHRGLGKTGVVGIIKNGTSTRAIGLRADMDALPMTEHNSFGHASKYLGKMHACGHDGHVAMLLAAAKHMARERHFDGTVYCVFQPAEEGGGGAREMVKDGIFTQFPMEAIFGMHNWPGMPVGKFAVSPGPVMASSNEFKIVIRGKGGHAALPHNGIDPVPIACQLVQAFQTIVTRNKKPVDTAVISVTMIHAGEATNVIPDSVEIQGTVRTFTSEVLDLIEKRMKELTEHLCAAFGATCAFEFQRNYPPTVNHVYEAEFARKVMASIVGESNVVAQEPTMGAEDFAYFLQNKPGAYNFIANGDGQHRGTYEGTGHDVGPCMLHNPRYDFNDDLIPLGATYWVRLVEAWLSTPLPSGR